MTDEAPFRVGLRVENLTEAVRFYVGLGFEEAGSIPGPDGQPIMAILRRGGLQLLVDSLTGMPFPDSARERMTKTGPRGPGVVIGIEVDSVDATADYCRSAGATVTTAPVVRRGASGTPNVSILTITHGSSFNCCRTRLKTA
jgi:catechol 2,3-dioxygenase-like lactoylglutathione lyase family enzyme